MSFVDAFFSFQVELNDASKGIFTTVRLKTPKHPFESLEHLFARVLTYLHCYRPGQVFTEGLYNLNEPTIWTRDVIGTLQQWVQVGPPDQKKLTRALRENNKAYYAVYLFEEGQQETYFNNLRGGKERLLNLVELFQIEPAKVVGLVHQAVNTPRWTVTIADGTLYLYAAEIEAEIQIESIDPGQLSRLVAANTLS